MKYLVREEGCEEEKNVKSLVFISLVFIPREKTSNNFFLNEPLVCETNYTLGTI